MRGVSNWPHPSLNGTHITMLGWFQWLRIIRTSSVSNSRVAAVSVDRSELSLTSGMEALGMSCQTRMPSRSHQE